MELVKYLRSFHRQCLWKLLIILNTALIFSIIIYKQSRVVFVGQNTAVARAETTGTEILKVRQKATSVNCEALFEGLFQTTSSKLSTDLENPVVNVSGLQTLASDCSAFQQTQGYIRQSSAEEENYPIAFSIKIHASGSQAEQLLRTIYRPQNTYCIHIDIRTAAEVHLLFKTIAGCFRNIFLVPDPIGIKYATGDHIDAELLLMNLCRRFGAKWKYYINLTGQEFPLKTNYELVTILKILNGSNDIESYPFIRNVFIKRMYNVANKTFPSGVKVYKGGAYGLFSRAFVDYILDNKKAQNIISFFSNTLSPEETVWATLNRLPDVPGGAIHDISHRHGYLSKAVIWQWDAIKCHGKFVRSVCVYSRRDLMWLRHRPELFANKFKSDFDQIALDCMEEEIRNRTMDGRRSFLNFHFYRNLPQSKVKPVPGIVSTTLSLAPNRDGRVG